MKKAIVALMCIGMAVSAFAQSAVNNVDQKHYNKIYFTYSPMSVDLLKLASVGDVNTFGINYLHGIAVADVPLYVEFGASLQYANYKLGGLKLDESIFSKDLAQQESDPTDMLKFLNKPIKTNAFALEIPLNFGYSLSLAGGKCHLTPFAGIFAKFNLSMKAKVQYYMEKRGDYTEYEYDLLAGSSYGENDGAWELPGYAKRFQLGWQAGIAFDVNKFYLQAGYRSDASSLLKCGLSAKTAGFNFGIGVIF